MTTIVRLSPSRPTSRVARPFPSSPPSGALRRVTSSPTSSAVRGFFSPPTPDAARQFSAPARHAPAIGLLSVALSAPLPVAAQPATPRSLPPVVVTATRQESPLDDQVAHVTVIERDAIEQWTGRSLIELLSAQAGVQFTSNGGLGKTGAVFIRGLESRHTLLLSDGIRYGSATSNLPIFEGIALDQIERIEIVRGPMSSLYGSDAVGGVIQVFTRRGQPGFRGHGSITAGSDRYGDISGGVSGGDERWDYAVTAQHLRTDGDSATNPNAPFGNYHPDDDGWRQSSLSANLGWRFLPDWQARVNVLESWGRSDIDDGQPAADPGLDSEAKLRTQVLGLSVAGRPRSIWRTTLRAARSEDRFDTIRSASVSDLGEFRTTQDQYAWENSLTLPWGNVLVGLERLVQSVAKPPPAYTVGERSINALLIGFDRTAGVHHLQASARHDRNSQFGSENTGTVGYGFDLTPAWRLGASYGTSFTAPSFNQLYFPSFGNPDLQPEEGKHGELNLRYAQAGHEVRVARYYSRIRGYITAGPQPTNIPRSAVDGWELAWTGSVGDYRARASLDWLDPRNEADGHQLPRRAKRHASAALDRAFGAWRIGGAVRAVDERYDDAANSQRLGGFTVIDLYADRRITPDWTIGVKLNNLADRDYETAFGYDQPGRALFVTARYAPK